MRNGNVSTWIVICLAFIALLFAATLVSTAEWNAEILLAIFWIVWGFGVLLIAVLGSITLWFSAMKRDGVAKGGTLGLIPAAVFFVTGIFIWPIYACVAWFNRRKIIVFYKELLKFDAA